jgi:hypothetical protein
VTTWTDIPDGNLEVGKPTRSIDGLALRDNVNALAEGAPGAPILPWQHIDGGAESAIVSLDIIDLTSAYFAYCLVMSNLGAASGAAPDLRWLASTDNGANFNSGAGDYWYAWHTATTAPTTANAGDLSSSILQLANSYAAYGNGKSGGLLWLFNPAGGNDQARVIWDMQYLESAGAQRHIYGAGARKTTTAVNAFRLAFSAGNIQTLDWQLYGLRAG